MALLDHLPFRRHRDDPGPDLLPVLPGTVQLSPFVDSPNGLVITREGIPVYDPPEVREAASGGGGKHRRGRGKGTTVAVRDPDKGKQPERAGYLYGIPEGGLDEAQAGMGASTQTDRKSMLQELYEAYLTCPWSWACVTAIARTITAGGLTVDFDADDSEGDQEVPDKPPAVEALERFVEYCNPTQDIRQVLRNTIADLLVFGGAYLEVAWWGSTPVAIWNLDYPTTTPLADVHGQVAGYVQVSDFGQRATFTPKQVIYISLDSARPGVFGVSPTQAAIAPITAWLFAHSTSKEMMRKGLPPDVHADMPASMGENELKRWRQQYLAGNLGSKNYGVPIITKGGAKLTLMSAGKVADCLAFMDVQRDEIASAYGVPPAEIGIIESGNLGGGTGESQRRSYQVNTCQPLAELVLEKLNFHLARQGFGVDGWHLKFRDVDMRDSLVIEQIRDMRLRNGGHTLNRYRTEIGEPPVKGGDDAVLVDRQNLVLWRDVEAMSAATVAAKGTTPTLGQAPAAPGQEEDQEEPAASGQAQPPGPGQQSPTGSQAAGKPPAKTTAPKAGAVKGQKGQATPKTGEQASWQRRYDAYRARLEETLRAMEWEPPTDE